MMQSQDALYIRPKGYSLPAPGWRQRTAFKQILNL